MSTVSQGDNQTSKQSHAWDPKSTATLMLSSGGNGAPKLTPMLSNTGIGASPFETSALLRLLETKESEVKDAVESARQILYRCLEEWEGDNAAKETTVSPYEKEKIELLKHSHSVLRLAQVFIFSKKSVQWTGGVTTAAMVRYLRLCHMDDLYAEMIQFIENHPDHPEEDTQYWEILEELVARGCLEDAWAMLSHHSICKPFHNQHHGTEGLNTYGSATKNQDLKALLRLRALLLSAPLPGGRSDIKDPGIDDDNAETGDSTVLLDGVQRTDHELWESSRISVSGIRTVGFNPHAASAAFRAWQNAVQDTNFDHLLTRMPKISGCIALLKGDLSVFEFESWAEALCTELIYSRPLLHPNDMAVRAKSLMTKFGENDNVSETLVSIMRGNAATVVEALHAFGGGSGAALPATMTALLCHWMVESQLVLKSAAVDKIQTDLLLSAAAAIVDSHHDKRDIGMRLCTLLLVPHIKPTGDERIWATLGDFLQRHSCESDTEAKQLLELVNLLLSKKNNVILNGCQDIILGRHNSYLKDRNFAGATMWLLRGLEVEQQLYGMEWKVLLASGMFGKLLVKNCLEISQGLLEELLKAASVIPGGNENADELGRYYAFASETVEAVEQDDLSESAMGILEVRALSDLLEIANAMAESDQKVATKITAFLDGVGADTIVMPNAHPSFRKNIFRLAFFILERDEDRFRAGKAADFQPCFDQTGVRVLMSCYMKLKALGPKDSGFDDQRSIHLALNNGLKRAFVAENAKRKKKFTKVAKESPNVQLRLSHLLSPEDQERVIAKALGDLSY